MSVFSSFGNMAAQFHTQGQGELVTFRRGGQGDGVQVRVIVFRDPINTRPEDQEARLEYPAEIGIAVQDYPDDNGDGGGQPQLQQDTVELYLRLGDAETVVKKISSIVSQVGGMWRLKLD